ncbi:unnamed protein product [Camellia sinensis]
MGKKLVKYCVDTFTDSPFKGNPSDVCFLDKERDDDEWFQTVARELETDSESETHDSSHLSTNPRFRLRWFNAVAQVPSISKALSSASVIDLKITTTEEDLIVVLPSGKVVTDLQLQFDEIQRCPGKAVIITGPTTPGSGFDFFSRVFDPKMGINEDLVIGSAHCALAGYWSKKLGKCDFVAYQASARGGILNLHLDEKI